MMPGLKNSVYLAALFVLAFVVCACSQNNGDNLHIYVWDPVVISDGGNAKISLRLECTNLTDSTYLLYGIGGKLGSFPKKPEDLSNYLEKMSAGLYLYIYNDTMREVRMNSLPLIHEFHEKYRRMPKERADSIVLASNTEYLKYTKIIAKGESIYLEKEMDLKAYELTKGIYYFQIAYCSGDKISVRIPPVQIDLDKKKHSAIVYRGCAISNIVKFEIE